jgi:hypothetical protein
MHPRGEITMTDQDRIATTVALFRARCERDRLHVTGDDRCSEASAALLLGLAEGTLRNLRASQEGPVPFRAGLNGCRITYRLHDIAAWIEARRGFAD